MRTELTQDDVEMLDCMFERIKIAQQDLEQNEHLLSPAKYLSKRIEILFKIDQASRYAEKCPAIKEIFDTANSHGYRSFHEYAAHELNEILNSNEGLHMNGWFPHPQYEADVATQAFLIAYHADHNPGFQRTVLHRLQLFIETAPQIPNLYACLYDRICINFNKAQRYGTQGTLDENGIWYPFECQSDLPRIVESEGSLLGMLFEDGTPWSLSNYFQHMNEGRLTRDDKIQIRFMPVDKNSPEHQTLTWVPH